MSGARLRSLLAAGKKPRLVTYGCNSSGALGRGEIGRTGYDSADVVPSDASDPPVKVAAGWGHTAFLTASGSIVACGRAYDMRNVLRFGKLASKRPTACYLWTNYLGGRGSVDFQEPTLLNKSPKCISISASAGLTLAVTEDGNAIAFGANRYGQTGTSDTERDPFVFYATPVKKPEHSSRWVSVAAGHQNACAVDEAGAVFAWGKSDRGQVGCGDEAVKDGPVRMPRQLSVFDPDGIKDVSCGFAHCAALSKGGRVYVWGKNQSDRGRANAQEPQLVRKLPPIAQISCGQFHTIALDVDGKVWQWGQRPSELGGDFVEEPRLISGTPRDITALSCGLDDSCALSAGIPFVWSWKNPRPKPIPALEKFEVLQVSFGWKHVAAIVA